MEVQGQVEGPEPGDVSWGRAHPPGVHMFASQRALDPPHDESYWGWRAFSRVSSMSNSISSPPRGRGATENPKVLAFF